MSKKTIWRTVVGLGVTCMLALAAWAGDGQEEKVTLDQVPAAVQATIAKESAGGKITEIEREMEDGETVYEAEFLLDGEEIEIRIAADGTLLGREVEGVEDDEDDMTIAQVPEPARKALIKLAGGAKFTEVEREEEHGVVVYEAQWSAKGVVHEAAVTADGSLVETEETIQAKATPAAVRRAIEKHFGANAKAVIKKKKIVVYEVEGKSHGRTKELLIFPTGKVHDEAYDDDDEHDDDDDGGYDGDDDGGYDGDDDGDYGGEEDDD